MGKGRFRTFDAFQKTVEEARIRTASGGLVTLAAACIIFWLVALEAWDWRRIVVRNELVVDKTRGRTTKASLMDRGETGYSYEHLVSSFTVCKYVLTELTDLVLSLDVMDASGEVQTDVASTMFKTRLDKDGKSIDIAKWNVEYNNEPPPVDYCGPCYGGKPPESGCCNTCKDVRDAYQENGWAINDFSTIEQCVREQYFQRQTS